ncbi:MAG: DUF5667 domain-containing protein [Candidatus Paceibacterota bacterium]
MCICIFVYLDNKGGTVSYAALGSIPGDLLYPVKIKIVEPVADVFVFSDIAKVEREAEKAILRLEEAEELATKEKLDSKSRTELEKQFDKNLENFDRKVRSVENSSEKEAEDLKASFESSLNDHAESLKKTGAEIEKRRDDEDESEASLFGKKVIEKATRRKEIESREREEKNNNKKSEDVR